jgi:15-cis-phytoene synthase
VIRSQTQVSSVTTDPNSSGAPPMPQLEHCKGITKHHASTFYLGSKFFPREQQYAVWAVYAACRVGDDTVDELEASQAAIEIEVWRNRVINAIEGNPDNDPMSVALCWAASRFPIKRAPFLELYLGLKADLEKHRYETLSELMLYCRRVAGMVGFMISPISGFEGGQETLDRALKLGMAMQLTNILRDVGEDLERGRIYLPTELLEKHGVSESDLYERRVTRGYVNLIRELDALARDLYREGWHGIPKLHGGARFAVALAAGAYEGILGAVERNGFDNFNHRAHLTNPQKLAMIPGTFWNLRRISAGLVANVSNIA